MSETFWMRFWWWWLAMVLCTFALPEVSSIALRYFWYRTSLSAWTLSDCIRRWSLVHHWLPALVCGASALLLAHWFLVPNRP